MCPTLVSFMDEFASCFWFPAAVEIIVVGPSQGLYVQV